MDVRLPNGTVIKNVPDGTSKEAVMQKAIAAGLAKPEDFGVREAVKVPASEGIPLFDDQGNPIEADMPRGQQKQKPDALGFLGPAEAILATGTGALGALQGAYTGLADSITSGAFLKGKGPEMVQQSIQEYAQSGAYQPRTQAGQAITKTIGEASSMLPPTLAGFTPTQSLGAMQAAGKTAQALGVERLASTKPKLTAEAARAAQFADENNLPLATSDVIPVDSVTGRSARIIGEKTPIVGTGKMRYEQQEARKGLLQQLREQTPEISDTAISKSLMESNDKYSQAVSKRYNDISQKMGETKLPIRKTIEAIDNELFELSREGVVKDDATIATLFKLRDDLIGGPQDFKTLRDNRTYIREELKASPDKPSSQANRVIDRVYSAMTDDIRDAVQKKLGDESRFKLDQVDKIYALEAKTQKKTKLRNALLNGDVKPEEATKVLFSNNATDVRELYKTLDDQGRTNARAAIINRMLEKADESPEKFLSATKQLKSQYGMFFRGAERAKMDGLISYLNATRRASQATVDTQTGQQNIPYIMAGAVGADLSGGGGFTTASIGTIAALNKIYESAPVRRALMRMSKAKQGTPEFDNAYIAVDTAVRSQMPQQQKEDK